MGKLLAVKYPITEFVKARQTLLTEKLMDRERKYVIDNRKVLFPLQNSPDPHQMELIRRRKGELIEIEEERFPMKGRVTKSLKALHKSHAFPIPRSLTHVGNIILINELPENAKVHKEEVGKILMDNFNARGVFYKKEEIEGEKRIAKWSRLAGWGEAIAIHKEAGFYYLVNFSKVFFNPRMGGERQRVVSKVKEGETVIDMFTGVGPFAIPMSAKGAKVYAIDINAAAIKLLKINKKLNEIDNVKIIKGDAKEEGRKLKNTAKRVIMNYPENSLAFLDTALHTLKKEGMIHFYCFSWGEREEEACKSAEKQMKGFFRERKRYTLRNMESGVVLKAAPAKYLVVLDMKIE